MDTSQQLIIGLGPVFVICALMLILLQTLRRRKKRGQRAKPLPVMSAIIIYAVGVAGLVFVTYAPQTGLAGIAAVRQLLLALFMMATAILVLSILGQRRA